MLLKASQFRLSASGRVVLFLSCAVFTTDEFVSVNEKPVDCRSKPTRGAAVFVFDCEAVSHSQLQAESTQDTGRGMRRVRKFERFSFDVACVQCGHSH